MTLKKLVGISLETINVDHGTVMRLIAAAERNIADSKITAMSTENRFDAAYKAIMQIANAAKRTVATGIVEVENANARKEFLALGSFIQSRELPHHFLRLDDMRVQFGNIHNQAEIFC